jgi:hypothetical protein
MAVSPCSRVRRLQGVFIACPAFVCLGGCRGAVGRFKPLAHSLLVVGVFVA